MSNDKRTSSQPATTASQQGTTPTPYTPTRQLYFQIGIYISGQAVSSIGNWVYIVALNILILQRTHSAFAVSGIWIVPFIATAAVGGWSGSITDRVNQRKLLIMMDVIRAITVATVPFMSSIWPIYALIFMEEAAGMFFGQASMPYQTRLVPPTMRKRVNAIRNSLGSGALLAGPAIAGALMFVGSPSFAIWVNALSFFISALTLFTLPNFVSSSKQGDVEHPRQVPPTRLLSKWSSRFAHLRNDWGESANFLRDNKLALLVICATTATGILAQGANSVEVVFAQDALHLGKVGYSTMVMCAGVGLVVGSVVITALTHRLSTRFLLAGGLLLTQLMYLMYALSSGLWTAALALLPLGLFNSAQSIGAGTYLQDSLPTEQMGRIMGVFAIPTSVLTVLSMALSGWASNHVPVRLTMIVLTVASSIIALVSTFLIMRLWNRYTALQSVEAGDIQV